MTWRCTECDVENVDGVTRCSNCDAEHIKRNPETCKKCEHREKHKEGSYCGFWGNWLKEILWCNK